MVHLRVVDAKWWCETDDVAVRWFREQACMLKESIV